MLTLVNAECKPGESTQKMELRHDWHPVRLVTNADKTNKTLLRHKVPSWRLQQIL